MSDNILMCHLCAERGGAHLRGCPKGKAEEHAGEKVKPVAKHSHYHRDISRFQGMDWYRFCDVFGVTHPCAQHAGKKIVFAGMRGAKDIDKDIQEAIDTLQRWQQMRREDSVSSN